MCKKHNALKSHGVIDRIEHRKSEDYSMLRPSIGIDWDDVTAPFNSIAIRMANEKYHPKEPYRMEEITSWANEGRTSVIKEFYNDPELYRRQIPTEETKRGIRRLMQIADVFFITAVSPHFMGVRAEQIMTQFPELPPENIILGSAKDRVHFDIVLDDAIHNILESKAEYPVLMRKPWNAKMTGLLSVNTMAEFVSLVKQIMKASTSKTEKITAPAVLALVGPSGSGKREITEALCGSRGTGAGSDHVTVHFHGACSHSRTFQMILEAGIGACSLSLQDSSVSEDTGSRTDCRNVFSRCIKSIDLLHQGLTGLQILRSLSATGQYQTIIFLKIHLGQCHIRSHRNLM